MRDTGDIEPTQFFPGLPSVSHGLTVAILVLLETVCLGIVFLWIKHWLPGHNIPSRMAGRVVGTLIGIFAAKFQATTVARYYDLAPAAVSVLLLAFIVSNCFIACQLFWRAPGPNEESPNGTPTRQ